MQKGGQFPHMGHRMGEVEGLQGSEDLENERPPPYKAIRCLYEE